MAKYLFGFAACLQGLCERYARVHNWSTKQRVGCIYACKNAYECESINHRLHESIEFFHCVTSFPANVKRKNKINQVVKLLAAVSHSHLLDKSFNQSFKQIFVLMPSSCVTAIKLRSWALRWWSWHDKAITWAHMSACSLLSVSNFGIHLPKNFFNCCGWMPNVLFESNSAHSMECRNRFQKDLPLQNYWIPGTPKVVAKPRLASNAGLRRECEYRNS